VHRGRLLDDLFKLALLLDARAGRLQTDKPFRVEAVYDDAAQRLTFGSVPLTAASERPSPADGGPAQRIKRAVYQGSLQEIVWNHAALGDHVTVPLAAGRKLEAEVGYHGLNGAHSFRALVLLAPCFPELVFEALRPLLVGVVSTSPAVAGRVG
jgi:hypothetical protein